MDLGVGAPVHHGAEAHGVFTDVLKVGEELKIAGLHVDVEALLDVRRIDLNVRARLALAGDEHLARFGLVAHGGVQFDLDLQLRAVDGHVAAGLHVVGRAHEDGDDVVADRVYVDVGRQKPAAVHHVGDVLAVDQHRAARHHLHLQRVDGGEHRQIVLRGTQYLHGRLRRGNVHLDGGQLRALAVFRDEYGGEVYFSALHLRQILPGEPVAVGHLHAGYVAGYRGGTAQFGDEDLVAVLGEEADGVGDAAVLQCGLADHGRALAAGVEALDLVVLHPVGELVDGETDHEYGDDRAQHKEDRAHKAAVPEALRRVGFYVFRKRLAARGTDDVRGAKRRMAIGTLQTGKPPRSVYSAYIILYFPANCTRRRGNFIFLPHVLSTIAQLML